MVMAREGAMSYAKIVVRLAGAAVLVSGLTGCSLSSLFGGVKFTNVSDSWLNVRYYTGTVPEVDGTDKPADDPQVLYRHKVLQVEPGNSVDYRPPDDLVHIRVETVTPTWEPTGKQYWLELLTEAPIHVVAGGKGKIEFKSFQGQIALIPDRQRKARFEYKDPAERSAQKKQDQIASGDDG